MDSCELYLHPTAGTKLKSRQLQAIASKSTETTIIIIKKDGGRRTQPTPNAPEERQILNHVRGVVHPQSGQVIHLRILMHSLSTNIYAMGAIQSSNSFPYFQFHLTPSVEEVEEEERRERQQNRRERQQNEQRTGGGEDCKGKNRNSDK
jgi:hypothetical protein